ncbi:MAG TPA: flagellar export protein FliJ [Gammaproteobacteria bacterium]|nr:flagellar export protein FliJ [Gammaproteobacteria bacterium]
MTKSERLTPVTKLVESKERDAARLLAEAQRLIDEREERLVELLGYLSEYQQRLQAVGSAGVEAGQMQDYHLFIGKLDEAIMLQKKLVVAAKNAFEERKRAWLVTRTACKAVGKVVERYYKEETLRIVLREQGESDDRAQYIRRKHEDEE